MKQNLLFILLLLLFSCQPASDDPVFIVDVEDEFMVSMKETLTMDETQRELVINLETIDPVTCSKSTILTENSISENQFVINIKGIEKPDPCDQILTVIKKDVPLNKLDVGIYNLQFILQETIFNWGQIDAGQSGYILQMQSDFGIEIAYDKLSKIPENTIWGYMASEVEQANIYGLLTSSLAKIGATNVSLQTGDYYYFKIYSGSAPDFDVTSTYSNHSKFLYRYDGSDTELQSVLDSIKDTYPDEALSFKIYTSKGSVLE